MIQQSNILPLLLLLIVSCSAQANFKLCAKSKEYNNCQKLNEQAGDVSCETSYNGIDCILNIDNGISSLGRISAEEAVLASGTSNVVVIGQIKHTDEVEHYKYETVVLVRKNHTNGFSGLKGRHLCHPGFREEKVSRYIFNELEEEILKNNNICNLKVPSNTLVEKHIMALSEFFSSACRPGAWVDDVELDKVLKTRYPKLCELCTSGSLDDKCSNINITDPFKSAIDCLLHGGDVAITTLAEVKEHVSTLNDYAFLCRNQTVSSDIHTSCSWSKQPWDLLVAKLDTLHDISEKLNEWFSFVEQNSQLAKFEGVNKTLDLFVLEDGEKLVTVNMKNISDYFKDLRILPNGPKCENTINWCVTSQDQRNKCNWLRQASLNSGIYPGINCTQSQSTLKCINDIVNNKQDIVLIDSDYGFAAKKSNLVPIAFPKTWSNNLKKTLLVVKNNSLISSFKDLKGKQGCFAKYGNIAWMAWLAAFENDKLLLNECNYDKKASTFVGFSCAPGIRDYLIGTLEGTDVNKLCSICAGTLSSKTAITCNSDEFNEYYGNNGALKCLETLGDFALISNEDIDSTNIETFRVLCKNSSLASYPGLNVDDDCYLSITIGSEIVIRRNELNRNNIEQMLHSYEVQLGLNHTKTFDIFNVFSETKDLLFKKSTLGIDFPSSSQRPILDYVAILKKYDDCATTVIKDEVNAATSINLIVPFIFLTLAALFFN